MNFCVPTEVGKKKNREKSRIVERVQMRQRSKQFRFFKSGKSVMPSWIKLVCW